MKLINFFLFLSFISLYANENIIDINQTNKKYEEATVEDHYDNAKIKLFQTYVNGKLNGISKGWYRNGNLWYEKTYKNGIVDGVVKVYYPDGSPKIIVEYKNGSFFKTIKKFYKPEK